MGKRVSVSREDIQRLYFEEGLPLSKIAITLSISEPTLRSRFRSYGFKSRPRGSWAVKHQKRDFSGVETEKAYLLGFRAGDLNVYRPKGNSNIIIARTNTTRIEQIDLMNRIFGHYGGVVSAGKGLAKNINCYLNDSFSFLLPKPYFPEEWITNNMGNALAFIAGYVDAEGAFVLNQGKARFQVDAYDFEILSWLHNWLLEHDINSKFRLLAKAGEAKFGNPNWKCDLWRLNINDAHSLLRFSRWMASFSLHMKRFNDIWRGIDNIQLRMVNGSI